MPHCNVIRDLLPLHIDGLTSEESENMLKEHLSVCKDCAAVYERMQTKEDVPEIEPDVFKKTLHSHKRKLTRKTILLSLLALFLGIGLCLGILWYNGVFHIIERQVSPDGETVSIVYNCGFLKHGNLPLGPGITVRETGALKVQTTYPPATDFHGLWWSPNRNYQVISLQTEDGVWLILNDMLRNAGINLSSRLEFALYGNDFFSNVVYDETLGKRLIEFQFIHWNAHQDASMLIHFNYADASGEPHEGYFWFNYETHGISGEMEIE